jgi:photosystem II stability/assembly factor-like uncharacterized protein
MRRRFRTAFLLLAVVAAAPSVLAFEAQYLAGMKARSIGPAAMSGRIAALDAVEANPDVLYVGTATGGVWKSDDGGISIRPIFDDQPVAAIGAVAIFQPAPDLVWVGTGEGNPRNSASVGDGVYKSPDGGKTWQHMGLAKSERIHRIVTHPSNPDIVWVAALGPTWGDGEERGVFKTTDGGKTWRKVLYVDLSTGAADLVLDPGNPQHLIAALWDHRRQPHTFRSGGPGSGLYSSWDGGETWKKAVPEDGLPAGDLGRIGLAMARSNPKVVYALVEQEGDFNSLFRSEDGGRTWKSRATTASQENLGDRPFYYSDLRVDPLDANRVYSLWSVISLSEDGGKTWDEMVPFAKAHPDHHAMWINPANPRHLYIGNDGGVYKSQDHGMNWDFQASLPLAQFYHVRYDMASPFNVYGGLQDNGSWVGPSAVLTNGGIRNHDWQEVHFGDGFDVMPDPRNPGRGWALSQGGHMVYWDRTTGEKRSVRPESAYGEPKLRFNWNAAMAIDPFDPGVIYLGSQFVHKSTDNGDSWTTISPDLTTNKPEWQKQHESGGLTLDVTSAENHTTLIAIAPSPVRKGVIWAGSDDGRLHVTIDGGEKWTSVEGNVPGVPRNTWIPHITPSSFDAGEAFVAFDDHRRSNWTPYVYKTSDFGATWTRLADEKDVRGYALVVAQDPVDRNLLFLGTEFGLWFSIDGGKQWAAFRHGVPTVSVMDLAIHPRDSSLIIATHGRGIYIVDDLQPLRDLDDAMATQKMVLFATPAVEQSQIAQAAGGRFNGDDFFRGENRPSGARLYYWLSFDDLPMPDEQRERERKEADRQKARKSPKAEAAPKEGGAKGGKDPKVEITIKDQQGSVVRFFEGPAKLGLNVAVWNLRRDGARRPRAAEPENPIWGNQGALVPPGTYTYTVRYRDEVREGHFEVVGDKRFEISADDRQARYAAQLRVAKLQEALAEAIDRVDATRRDVDYVVARLKERQEEEKRQRKGMPAPTEKSTLDLAIEQGGAVKKGLDALENKLWEKPGQKGIRPENHAWGEVSDAVGNLNSSWRRPSASHLTYVERAQAAVDAVLPEVNAFFEKDVAAFRGKAAELEVAILPPVAALQAPARP